MKSNIRHILLFLGASLLTCFAYSENKEFIKTIKYDQGDSIIDKSALVYHDEILHSNIINLDGNFSITDIVIDVISSSDYKGTHKTTSSPSCSLTYTESKSRYKSILEYKFNPYYSSNGRSLKVDKYKISVIYTNGATSISRLKSSNKSILSSGKWVKVKFQSTGIYKITGSTLKSFGFSNIKSVHLYGHSNEMLSMENESEIPYNLPEIPIQVFDNNDGSFDDNDYILFFGHSPNYTHYSQKSDEYYKNYNCYSQNSYILITTNRGSTKQINRVDNSDLVYEKELDYYYNVKHIDLNETNPRESGREAFGTIGSQTFNFSFTNAISTKDATITYKTLATSSSSTSYTVSAPNLFSKSNTIGKGTNTSHSSSITFNATSSQINVSVSRNSSAGKFWLDYITVSVPSKLTLSNGQLYFHSKESINHDIVQYSISNKNITVWKVTDYNNTIEINTTNGSFKSNTNGKLQHYIAFDNTTFHSVDYVSTLSNQNIVGDSPTDVIIIAHPEFHSQAQRLANFHQTNDGLSSQIVTQQQIFNEFSAGRPDITSIRNFVRARYASNSELKYLLLFGDGSYDNSAMHSGSTMIATYQSPGGETHSFVSDDYFGLLDYKEGEISGKLSGALDIGIGRLPVNSEEQASTVVDKIIHYSTSSKSRGKWRNNMCFLADDGDGNLHMSQSNILTDTITNQRGEVIFTKIFADAYPKIASAGGSRYPEANRRILDAINKGVLVFNYTGHGNPVQFAVERLLTVSELQTWENYNQLPLVITASCEVSRYDDPHRRSIGEQMLLHNSGGAIGLLTTTRLVYANPNFKLNLKLFDYFYEQNEWGKANTLGDIIRKGKVAMVNDLGQNKRNFSLLGDPAMKLAIPEFNIITDSINGVSVHESLDTLPALSLVSISGHIEDDFGNIATNYNGIIYPTVFDKSREVTTLSNNADSAFKYNDFLNILFQGKASINNGHFTFTFKLPEDISYKVGSGKISYYADNGTHDASGVYSNFLVGGEYVSNNDTEGPEIEIFMNDTNFVFGGITDESPELILQLEDTSGINISGNAIGHDITVVIDNDMNNSFILNEFYEANLNDYTKGTVRYKLSQLENGKHTLKAKVWDASNNANEEFTEFYVAENAKTALEHVLNYPNPFTTRTSFLFEHNQAGKPIDIQIQIFTISGKLVKTIYSHQLTNGYRGEAIDWDGKDDFGDKIARGVYFYKLKVTNPEGETDEVFEKLVILK